MGNLFTVIATSKRARLLHRTLASLAECHKPTAFSGVFVVENGPDRSAEKTVQHFQGSLNIHYLHTLEANKSKALNHVLERIPQGLLFFTDDDIRFHPDTLAAYAEAAQLHNTGTFFGGPMGVDYDSEPPDWLKEYLPPSAVGWEMPQNRQPLGDALFRGCNWAAFAQDLLAVGGFDPEYGPGSKSGARGQESEIQRRLLQNGVNQIYLPHAVVWHYVPKDRCSTRWALGRAYQHGVESGLSHPPPVGHYWWGYPRWMIRQLAEQFVIASIYSFNRYPQRRFENYYQFVYHIGRMKGIRQALIKQP